MIAFFCFEIIESYCREILEMGRKRGGSYCYQPEKLSFLAEAAANNATFETTYPPSAEF
jgi:hypothetical protein